MMLFADVIMPCMMPYLAWIWFFPLIGVALLLEMAVFAISYRRLKPESIFACTLGANAASWFLGIFVSGLLVPGGIVRKPVLPNGTGGFYYAHATNYDALVVCAFIVALIFSILIEWGVWRFIFRKSALKSLGLMSTLANVLSYGTLITCFYYVY